MTVDQKDQLQMLEAALTAQRQSVIAMLDVIQKSELTIMKEDFKLQRDMIDDMLTKIRTELGAIQKHSSQ